MSASLFRQKEQDCAEEFRQLSRRKWVCGHSTMLRKSSTLAKNLEG